MTPLVSVVNLSKRVTDDEARRMTLACGRQLADDFGPVYGAIPALEFIPSGGAASIGSTICFLGDEPDVDGALGYHDIDAQGNPYIKVFTNPTLDNGGTVLSGPESVSCTLSHELLELEDVFANMWCDGPDGSDYAFEMCDGCQGDTYDIDGVTVSDFLYPDFFNPRSRARMKKDHLGLVSSSFTTRPSGYQIHRAEPGKISQIFGSHPRTITAHHSMIVAFGPDFPSWKQKYKMRKATLKKGR